MLDISIQDDFFSAKDLASISNDILFFPSWLTHEVEKNNSQEERIVISFNIELKRRNNG